MIGLVGPRWRRSAELPEHTEPGAIPGPWTPPPAAQAAYETFRGEEPSSALTPPAGPTAREIDEPSRAAAPPPVEPAERETDGPSRAAMPPREEHARGFASEPLPTAAVEQPRPARTRTVRRRPARVVVVGVAALLVAAAAAVAVVASGGEETSDPPSVEKAVRTTPGVTLRAGRASAATAPGYKRVSAPPELAGLELEPVAVAGPAADGEQGALLLGFGPKSAHTSSLLPPEFLSALGLRADIKPDSEPARLGKAFPAYRYSGLRAPKLARALDLYVAPTTAGVLTLACVAPKELDVAFADGCAAAAQSVQAEGVRGFPLGPDRDYASGLSTIVHDLRAHARTGHAALRRTTADEGRYRSAARVLGDRFGEAATAFERLDAEPGAGEPPAPAPARPHGRRRGLRRAQHGRATLEARTQPHRRPRGRRRGARRRVSAGRHPARRLRRSGRAALSSKLGGEPEAQCSRSPGPRRRSVRRSRPARPSHRRPRPRRRPRGPRTRRPSRRRNRHARSRPRRPAHRSRQRANRPGAHRPEPGSGAGPVERPSRPSGSRR